MPPKILTRRDHLRSRSPSEIQFILITKQGTENSFLLPPEEFDTRIIEFIKYCPKDIIQLKDGIDFYEIAFRYGLNNPYDFNVIYDANVKFFLPDIKFRKQVKLFFIDLESKDIHDIISSLRMLHSPLHYYCLINENENTPHLLENVVGNPEEFIWSIIQDQQKIGEELGYPDLDINPSLFITYKKFIELHYFIPSRNNYLMMNSLIGNFITAPDNTSSKEELMQKVGEESSSAHKQPNSFTRQNIFVSQIKKLDYFLSVGLQENVLKKNMSTEALYAPIVLIAPFHNPDTAEFHGLPDTVEIKNILDSIQVEQTENYITQRMMKEDVKPEFFIGGMQYMQYLLAYLDDVAFLHASNWYSPVVRLPFKGKSIYRELSFFRTSAFAHLSNPKNRKNLQKTITRFSDVYKKSSISPQLEKIIKERNRQVIVMSDLPIEWLHLDGIPFSFTHDICRLPMAGFRGLMSLYAKNNQFAFTVSKDILKKTLVIFGSNEPAFLAWQNPCLALAKEKGFNAVYCNNIAAVREELAKYNPDFLIFDCHGSYDKKSSSTYLWIGNEKLTNEVIVKENITAPLVFLSACGTAPTYGTINTIANSFFENGCFSVTTTYMPVEINSSSILYLRLLNKLEMAAEKGLHKNWLEFASHVIRTSSVLEKFNLARFKSAREIDRKLREESEKALLDSLLFSRRRKLHNTINERIKKLSGIDVNTFENVIPEYLFYSNLGRSDLLYFETWLTAFREKNDAQISVL